MYVHVNTEEKMETNASKILIKLFLNSFNLKNLFRNQIKRL